MAGWCGRPGSNRTPPVWKTGTQPTTPRPQEWSRRNGRGRRRCSIRPALSVSQHPTIAWDRPPGSRDGGEYRDRTCASRRTRRVSTALPYRSANSPIQMAWKAITCAQASDAIGLSSGQLTNDGALDWARTSIGPFRRRLTVQLVHERMLEAPAGAAPAHGGFADRRVPVSPRGPIGCAHRNRNLSERIQSPSPDRSASAR